LGVTKTTVKGALSLINVSVKFPDGRKWKYPLPAVPRVGDTVIADGKRYSVQSVEWSCHEWDKYDGEVPHVRLILALEEEPFIRE
jgi:hypothetical protein